MPLDPSSAAWTVDILNLISFHAHVSMALFVISSHPEMRKIYLKAERKDRLFHVTWEEFEEIESEQLVRGVSAEYLVFDCRSARHVTILQGALQVVTERTALKTIPHWAYFRQAGMFDHELLQKIFNNEKSLVYTIDPKLVDFVTNVVYLCAACDRDLHGTTTAALYCFRDSGLGPRLDINWTGPERDLVPERLEVHNGLSEAIIVLVEEAKRYKPRMIPPDTSEGLPLVEYSYRLRGDTDKVRTLVYDGGRDAYCAVSAETQSEKTTTPTARKEA